MQDYHIKEQIQWKPNAPWGGGGQAIRKSGQISEAISI